jgi:hypothetical protein
MGEANPVILKFRKEKVKIFEKPLPVFDVWPFEDLWVLRSGGGVGYSRSLPTLFYTLSIE